MVRHQQGARRAHLPSLSHLINAYLLLASYWKAQTRFRIKKNIYRNIHDPLCPGPTASHAIRGTVIYQHSPDGSSGIELGSNGGSQTMPALCQYFP